MMSMLETESERINADFSSSFANFRGLPTKAHNSLGSTALMTTSECVAMINCESFFCAAALNAP